VPATPRSSSGVNNDALRTAARNAATYSRSTFRTPRRLDLPVRALRLQFLHLVGAVMDPLVPTKDPEEPITVTPAEIIYHGACACWSTQKRSAKWPRRVGRSGCPEPDLEGSAHHRHRERASSAPCRTRAGLQQLSDHSNTKRTSSSLGNVRLFVHRAGEVEEPAEVIELAVEVSVGTADEESMTRQPRDTRLRRPLLARDTSHTSPASVPWRLPDTAKS
jgi:hypothetical protein